MTVRLLSTLSACITIYRCTYVVNVVNGCIVWNAGHELKAKVFGIRIPIRLAMDVLTCARMLR